MGVSKQVELPRDPAAARLARRLLEELSVGRLEADELDRGKLLVSELVNNAVLHGRGRITLRVDLDEDRLRAEVIDEGSGFERVVRDDAFDPLGGWGLALVEAESSRWGVHEGTTHVWFEIDQPGPRMARTRTPTQPIATDQHPALALVQSRAARPSAMLFKRLPVKPGAQLKAVRVRLPGLGFAAGSKGEDSAQSARGAASLLSPPTRLLQ